MEDVKSRILASIIELFEAGEGLRVIFDSFVRVGGDRRSRSLAEGEWRATFSMTGSQSRTQSALSLANSPNNGITDDVQNRLDPAAYDSATFGAQSSASQDESDTSSSSGSDIIIFAAAGAGAVVVIAIVGFFVCKKARHRERGFDLDTGAELTLKKSVPAKNTATLEASKPQGSTVVNELFDDL